MEEGESTAEQSTVQQRESKVDEQRAALEYHLQRLEEEWKRRAAERGEQQRVKPAEREETSRQAARVGRTTTSCCWLFVLGFVPVYKQNSLTVQQSLK